jgi:hypothetical protein
LPAASARVSGTTIRPTVSKATTKNSVPSSIASTATRSACFSACILSPAIEPERSPSSPITRRGAGWPHGPASAPPVADRLNTTSTRVPPAGRLAFRKLSILNCMDVPGD